MKRWDVRKTIAVVLTLCCSNACFAAPCDGVRRQFGNDKFEAYALRSEKQLNVARIELLDAFQYREWVLLYEETHVSDEVVLLYKGEDFGVSWSGAAKIGEEGELEDWIRRQAPGIPTELAQCFGWYVTQGRSR